jgi:thioesterase domain-containing protein
VALQRLGRNAPLFLVPSAGGNWVYLRHLASHLGPTRPIYALQQPGLTGATPPLSRIEDLATYFLRGIRRIQPRGPYNLGGHSFGASVALEIARQLGDAREEVALLAVIDAAPPLRSISDAQLVETDDSVWVQAFARDLARFHQVDLEATFDKMSRLRCDRQVEVLLNGLIEAGLQTASSDVTRIQELIRVYRLNAMAQASYRWFPEQNLFERIVLFRASARDHAHSISVPARQCWGWSDYSRNSVEAHDIPGTHFTMLLEPNVVKLAERLDSELARSEILQSTMESDSPETEADHPESDRG